MSTIPKLITAEELLAMGDIGPSELIYGEVVRMSPSGMEHGRITAELATLIGVWNKQHKLGIALGAEAGFCLERNPDLVRAPDVAYVRADRVTGQIPIGFFEGPPDLAVEVVSPSDTWPDVQAKIDMWLAHGCQSCWIVDPRNQVVHACRHDGSVRKLSGSQTLEDPVLPGFSVSISSIFAL